MKARTTQEITRPIPNGDVVQMAAAKFVRRVGVGQIVEVLYRRGAIVYGTIATELIAAGKAVAVIDKPSEGMQ